MIDCDALCTIGLDISGGACYIQGETVLHGICPSLQHPYSIDKIGDPSATRGIYILTCPPTLLKDLSPIPRSRRPTKDHRPPAGHRRSSSIVGRPSSIVGGRQLATFQRLDTLKQQLLNLVGVLIADDRNPEADRLTSDRQMLDLEKEVFPWQAHR